MSNLLNSACRDTQVSGYLLLCKYPTPTPIPTPKQEKLNKNQHDTYNITLHIIHNLYNHNTLFNYLSFPYPLSLYLNPKIATHIKNQILIFILLHLYSLQTRKSHHKNFQAIGFMAITMSPQGPKTYTIRQSQSPKSSTQ